MTAADARARIQERFGVEAVADGGLTVTLPRERWQEFAGFVRGELGCRYFNWLSAVDWKEQGLEVLCRVENLDAPLVVTMRTRLPAGETHCPSLTALYRGADFGRQALLHGRLGQGAQDLVFVDAQLGGNIGGDLGTGDIAVFHEVGVIKRLRELYGQQGIAVQVNVTTDPAARTVELKLLALTAAREAIAGAIAELERVRSRIR